MTSLRSIRGVVAGCAVLGGALTAGAAVEVHINNENPELISDFTFDFNEFGASTALIGLTQFDLRLDSATGAASLDYYYQEVDSITLPGGVPTGDLIIAVLPGTSTGTYNSATGEFATEEIYVIYFAGDLSAFGLESPVYLPGSSAGQYSFDSVTTGATSMTWDGAGAIPSPGGGLLPFTYQCRVNTNFVADMGCPQAGCAADVDNDCDVDLEDLAQLLAGFGSDFPGASPRDGDVNLDGRVDLQDLSLMLGELGNDCN